MSNHPNRYIPRINRKPIHTVINDGMFRYPVLTSELEKSGVTIAQLRDMSGDAYADWCTHCPMDYRWGDVGSQSCITACRLIERMGGDVWHIG